MQAERLGAPRLGRMRRVLAAALGRPGHAPDTKTGVTGALIALDGHRQPQWAPRDYATFAREGMMQNPVAYRSVRMIAEACASVPLLLYDRDREIETHPILDLLATPAPGQTNVDLFEALFSQLLVSGNAFVEAVAVADEIRELYTLRSDRIQIVPGANGWGDGYIYSAGGRTVAIDGAAAAGIARILHLRFYHPLNDHYGLSPIEAAATAIDIHNEASRWNKALLDNSARPSGALVYGSSENMTPAQFERLKRELEDSFQGARNAGRPLLLEGGLDWKAMSLSPRDMDFIALKQMAAREIALALGVPPLLLGLPGDNTFANYQEANRTFWRQTVIPLVTRTAKALSGWLGGGLQLRPDLDQLDALAPDREALWARLDGASFLTDDEKRAAAGYGPRTGGVGQKFDPHHDEAGRFTFAPGGGSPSADDAVVLAQGDRQSGYPIDLRVEEARGGHTIGQHVNVNPERLAERVSKEAAATVERGDDFRGLSIGSFSSLEAATKLVNSTIAENSERVQDVASGNKPLDIVEKRFDSITGYEAYLPSRNSEPYSRDTYAVRLFILRDRQSQTGYRVQSAIPVR